MQEEQRLTRRTNSPYVKSLNPLPENPFWQQVQSFLASYLKQSDYSEELYVPHASGTNTVASDILAFISANSLNCYLLVGQYGVGKTSALEHFNNIYIKKKGGFASELVWIYVDAEKFTQELINNPTVLIPYIKNYSAKVLKKYLIYRKLNYEDFLRDIYENDIIFEGERLLYPNSKKAIDNVKKTLSESPEHYLVAILSFLARKAGTGKVILVVDNVDGFPQEVQINAVRTVSQVSKQCGVKGIVAVRRTTAFELSYSDPRILGTFVQMEISPPKISVVIQKRVDAALEKPEAKNAKLGEGAYIFAVRDCPEFSEILSKGLSLPQVERLIEGLSNDSVQDALRFAVKVYGSHFIDARRIIRKLSPPEAILPSVWKGHFPYYIVLKSLILCNRPAYISNGSVVGNIFGTTHSSSHLGPFLRAYILSYFAWFHAHAITIGKLIKDLIYILEADELILKEEIEWLQNKNWIEHQKGDDYAITKLGSYIIGELIYDIEYLTHISIDVDMDEELESRLNVPADSPKERMNNLLSLLEYLAKSELVALIHLAKHGLPKFTHVFGTLTPRIFHSAQILLEDVKVGTVSPDIGDVIDLTLQSLNKLNPTVQKIIELVKSKAQ